MTLDRRFRRVAAELNLAYAEACREAEQEWVQRVLRSNPCLPNWIPHRVDALASHLGVSAPQAMAEARLQWTLKHETLFDLQSALSWTG
jgi:hypothetical protein